MRPKLVLRFCAAAAVLALSAPSAPAAFLTGGVLFSAHSNGQYSSEHFWNTRGPSDGANLYITQANSGVNGAFLNSGDGPTTAINVDLSAPGTYQFYYFANGGGGGFGQYHGLNLFFDGAAPPQISALTLIDTTPPPHPGFTANSHSVTRGLTGIVAGSGALLYSSGGTTITLTEFRSSSPSVESRDRVSFFNNAPGDGFDTVGSFTLTVTSTTNPVPAPPGLVLGAIGAACLGLYQLRRRVPAVA